MLTIFTIPKPFIGLDDIHQRNAIQSWLAIRPECEVILCGVDQGVAEAAKEFGVVHIPDIPVNEFGTPYLDAAFQRAQQIAKNDLMCYVNADIIFFDDLIDAVNSINLSKYLLVGRRWNLTLDFLVNFQKPDIRNSLKERAKIEGNLNKPLGSDYFIFKKNSLGQLPSFLVGRPWWDNWMIFNARSRNIPVIDCSQGIVDIHQDHDYTHVPQRVGNLWYGPEAFSNQEFVGIQKLFTLWDATHYIDSNSMVLKVRGEKYLKRKIQTLSVLKPREGLPGKWQAFMQRVLRSLYYRRKKIPYSVLEFTVKVFSALS